MEHLRFSAPSPTKARGALRTGSLLASLLLGTAGVAQQAAAPWEAGCLVTELDPSGDGFLSIRTGPGSDYDEISRVRNGDALFIDTRDCEGDWCYAEGGAVGGETSDVQGWFHTGWCEFYP